MGRIDHTDPSPENAPMELCLHCHQSQLTPGTKWCKGTPSYCCDPQQHHAGDRLGWLGSKPVPRWGSWAKGALSIIRETNVSFSSQVPVARAFSESKGPGQVTHTKEQEPQTHVLASSALHPPRQ